MNDWVLLITASLLGSLFSLIGGLFLLSKRLSPRKVQLVAVPFAAGALLAAAFIELIPEALESSEPATTIMSLVLCGFILFFILERFLGWFHHHHDHPNTDETKKRQDSTKSLIIVGDTLHNALDGMVIGAAFLADPTVGIITTVAVAAHEIPQEIGDFGVLLALGMSRRKVLLVNILSAIITVITASVVYGFGSSLIDAQPVMLALAAGLFVYIAASDLVPTIHEEPSLKTANLQTLILIFGVIFVGVTTTLIHGAIETEDPHHTESHETGIHPKERLLG
jgi:zinc and cadmium transporter